jgi:hypothetical protein
MAQPYDFPERMMAGVPARWYMEHKLSKPGIGLGIFDPEAFDEYVRCFDWKTIKGSCADYRACPTSDFDMDKADFEAGRKITLPLLVIWGQRSHRRRPRRRAGGVEEELRDRRVGRRATVRPLRARGSAQRDLRAPHQAFQGLAGQRRRPGGGVFAPAD